MNLRRCIVSFLIGHEKYMWIWSKYCFVSIQVTHILYDPSKTICRNIISECNVINNWLLTSYTAHIFREAGWFVLILLMLPLRFLTKNCYNISIAKTKFEVPRSPIMRKPFPKLYQTRLYAKTIRHTPIIYHLSDHEKPSRVILLGRGWHWQFFQKIFPQSIKEHHFNHWQNINERHNETYTKTPSRSLGSTMEHLYRTSRIT